MTNQPKKTKYAKTISKLGLGLTLGAILLLLVYGLGQGDWISGLPYLIIAAVIGLILWTLYRT